MKNFKIKLFVLLLTLINIFSISNFSTEIVPSVDTSEKIYDYANIFNTSDEKTIYDRIISAISTYNLDIVIVTINDNPYYDSYEFAKEFFIQNNFGFASNKNGILYLIDFDNLETAIYANGTANKFFTENICKTINNSVYKYYYDEEYTTSAFTFLNHITLYGSNYSKYNTDFDTSKKIYDYANLLTTTEEEKLFELVTKYIDKTNYDMVIVTINNNPKHSAMVYADDFYDYNCFGLDSEYSGILFLIDMDTREMWISTTGKCIKAYSDSEIDSILDYTYDEISAKDYYECAKVFIEKADFYRTGITTNTNSSNNRYNYNSNYYFEEREVSIEAVFFATLIVTILFIAIATSKHKTAKKAVQANAYAKNFSITYRNDIYLRKNTTKIYDPPSSSSSSSGGGGFSSSHRSSSGRSHGGGGRRF